MKFKIYFLLFLVNYANRVGNQPKGRKATRELAGKLHVITNKIVFERPYWWTARKD